MFWGPSCEAGRPGARAGLRVRTLIHIGLVRTAMEGPTSAEKPKEEPCKCSKEEPRFEHGGAVCRLKSVP